jgi:hypothetical protein
MSLRLINNYARTLSGVVIASWLVASYGHAQNANPLTKLRGNWSGSGSISLASGTKEKILCRSGYIIEDKVNNTLRMDLRCTGNTYKFELQSDLSYNDGKIDGVWSELTRSISGKMFGSIVGNQLRVIAESPIFQASIDLTTRGDSQSIRIQSPGSEMSEVLVSLNRNLK